MGFDTSVYIGCCITLQLEYVTLVGNSKVLIYCLSFLVVDWE